MTLTVASMASRRRGVASTLSRNAWTLACSRRRRRVDAATLSRDARTLASLDISTVLVGNKLGLTCLTNDAVCGNGALEIGERCDDSNTASCDGCSSTCRVKTCGNGIIECGEQCDDGDNENDVATTTTTPKKRKKTVRKS